MGGAAGSLVSGLSSDRTLLGVYEALALAEYRLPLETIKWAVLLLAPVLLRMQGG